MKLNPLASAIALLLLGACQSGLSPTDVSSPSVLSSPPAPVSPSPEMPTQAPTDRPPATVPPTEPLPLATATVEPVAPTPSVEPSVIPTATSTGTPVLGTAAPSIQLVQALTGDLSNPVYLTHAFDDRLFIVERIGMILIAKDGQLLLDPFLDIRDRVGASHREQGLFSVAFHPGYAVTGHPGYGRFFASYTDRNGDTTISGFQASTDEPNLAIPESEAILLHVSQPFQNHNGGQIQFGPDGYLYIGLGDGGSGGDPLGYGQNPGTLLGALLRLNVDDESAGEAYAIPFDNPFLNDEAGRDEIWAVGLRNPWRFSFDRLTGDLYVADVGQNIWEEVSFQPADSVGGANYGWNIVEGFHCFRSADCDMTGLQSPIFEYDHSQGCSVTGGYVYRGQQFPNLRGNYFVSDFCSGIIWSIFRNSDGSWSVDKVLESGLQVSSFGEDLTGELYVLDYANGRVYQIQPRALQ